MSKRAIDVSTSLKLGEKKKRGRPPLRSSGNSATSREKKAGAACTGQFVDSLVNFVARLPSIKSPTGSQTDQVLHRIAMYTADVFEESSFASVIAKASGMSEQLAQKVVEQKTPLTIKMLAAIANGLNVSVDHLLFGKPPLPLFPNNEEASDEKSEATLLKNYRLATEEGRAAMHFILSIEALLIHLPQAMTSRVIAGLAHLYDAGDDARLAFLPTVLGRYKVMTGVDPFQFLDTQPVFTPLHESVGIYGPEREPFVKALT